MAEGSPLYVCFALTWNIPGFVLTCLILTYSVAQILDAAFFPCLLNVFEDAMCGTLEALCVFSVCEINSTYFYYLYLNRS